MRIGQQETAMEGAILVIPPNSFEYTMKPRDEKTDVFEI